MIDFIRDHIWLLFIGFISAFSHGHIKQELTFTGLLKGSVVAAFVAYMTDAVCVYYGIDGGLKTGIVGVASFIAPNILLGILTASNEFGKNPLGVIDRLRKK